MADLDYAVKVEPGQRFAMRQSDKSGRKRKQRT